jgi:DNA-binding CsgD family transcriptional regulator/tetratricopeptide (TPR) repeat protein
MDARTDQRSLADLLAAGHTALAEGAWEEARDAFAGAVERTGDDAPSDAERGAALEGLGWAGWWLADEALTMESRERAFRAYRDAGECGAAARVGAWLAADHREFRGDPSAARGWLQRAHSALTGPPESADHGWVMLMDADFALNLDADVTRAERLSLDAVALGRRLAIADLEAVGLAQGGIATVLQGRVDEGMRRLDEASVIAANERLQLPVSAGWALCCLISACAGVGDFERAAQWCATMERFAERWGGRQIAGVCRSAYGRVLASNGDWPAADAALTGAVADLAESRPGMVAGGLVRLGEHRARQGRTEEARDLFESAGPAGLVGLGQLALDDGDARNAADVAERVLRAIPGDVLLERLPALELRVRARAALGDGVGAAAALAGLWQIVERLHTPYLRARAHLVAGELAAASGDHELARQECEDAVDCFVAGSAPYETALARVELAGALAALGEQKRADAEAMAARETFARLGAQRDLERAERRTAETARRHRAGGETDSGRPGPAELSPREIEVLGLVAQGLSDAEIAERLVVSPHTVHRHVANIRAKLRLPSRAAAVAYAARCGLL